MGARERKDVRADVERVNGDRQRGQRRREDVGRKRKSINQRRGWGRGEGREQTSGRKSDRRRAEKTEQQGGHARQRGNGTKERVRR